MIQIRQVGGAINDVDPMATAYAHRSQNFCVGAVGYGSAALSRHWDAHLQPFTDGLYLSFDTDTRPERIHDAFPAATLQRLRAVKAVYDPEDVFEPSLPLQAVPSERAAA
jgi:hypothetical protein